MTQISNTKHQYGIIAILLHWSMALLIIFQIILGLYMVSLPNVGFDTFKIKLILLHKELGVVVLLLVIVRLIWRLMNPVPQISSQVPQWQALAARLVHSAFYGFMVAMPLTGWFLSSAAGFPVSFFGLFTLPNLISPNTYKAQFYSDLHTWLGYGLIVTIVMHVGGALMHHFFYKDDTLRRMLPRS